MKLCVPVPCFFPNTDFPDAVRQIASLGFNTIETYRWAHLDFAAVKAALDKTGVRLISMCNVESRMTDPAFREVWLDCLRETCPAAVKLGVGKLITQVGADTGAPREEQHAEIVETCRRAVPILEEYNITLMLEPLNSLVNHPGYYLTSSKEAFEIIREVSHPLVKIVFDIYHMQVMEGNIISSITGNLDCIAHLHAAGTPGRHELQSGENDYKVIFDAVSKAGYTGACGLEYNPLLPPVESLRIAKKLYG